jgi:hypothetical protein
MSDRLTITHTQHSGNSCAVDTTAFSWAHRPAQQCSQYHHDHAPVRRGKQFETARHQLAANRRLQDGSHVASVQGDLRLDMRHAWRKWRRRGSTADAQGLGQQRDGRVDLAADLCVGGGVGGDQRAGQQVLQLLQF